MWAKYANTICIFLNLFHMNEIRQYNSRISLYIPCEWNTWIVFTYFSTGSLRVEYANTIWVFFYAIHVSEIRQHNSRIFSICSVGVKYTNFVRVFLYRFPASEIHQYRSWISLCIPCEWNTPTHFTYFSLLFTDWNTERILWSDWLRGSPYIGVQTGVWTGQCTNTVNNPPTQ